MNCEIFISEKKTLKKKSYEFYFSCLFFTISTISKILYLIKIPREITYIPFILLFFVYIIKNFNKIKLIDAIYYIFITFVLAFGLTKYGSYITQRNNLLATFIVFFPAYYFFRFVKNENIYFGFKLSCYLDTIYYFLFFLLNLKNSDTYDMDFAYHLSAPICFFFYSYIKTKKKTYFLLSFLLLFLVLLSGNRGAFILPLLCVLYFILVNITNQKNTYKKMKSKVLFVIFIGFILLAYSLLVLYANSNDITSRTIEKIAKGEFFSSSSRDKLYEICTSLISKNKFGYGPLASRMLITGDWYIYPHSLFYELLLDYGIYFGFIFFVFIIYSGIIVLIKYRNNILTPIIGFLIIVGLGQLMISSSYYIELYVPAIIAIYIKLKLRGEKNENCFLCR